MYQISDCFLKSFCHQCIVHLIHCTTADMKKRLNYSRTPPRNLDKRTTITIGEQTFVVEADDLEKICDLGRGAYGIVEKMKHIPSGTIMAVKVVY